MTNGNDGAFCGYATGEVWIGSDGLTKREHFASTILAGLVANPDFKPANEAAFATQAVLLADALIEALNQ